MSFLQTNENLIKIIEGQQNIIDELLSLTADIAEELSIEGSTQYQDRIDEIQSQYQDLMGEEDLNNDCEEGY